MHRHASGLGETAIGFVPVTSAPRLFTMGPGSGEIDLVLTLLEADLLGDGASD